ncbi:MAG: hypothetical protein M3R18_01970, partial [Pseudomonadota bacterium]|nr:hypothetical protein [Pseudomonadota bacterium]
GIGKAARTFRSEICTLLDKLGDSRRPKEPAPALQRNNFLSFLYPSRSAFSGKIEGLENPRNAWFY